MEASALLSTCIYRVCRAAGQPGLPKVYFKCIGNVFFSGSIMDCNNAIMHCNIVYTVHYFEIRLLRGMIVVCEHLTYTKSTRQQSHHLSSRSFSVYGGDADG